MKYLEISNARRTRHCVYGPVGDYFIAYTMRTLTALTRLLVRNFLDASCYASMR